MKKYPLLSIIAHGITYAVLCVLLTGCATNYAERPQVKQFIAQMASKDQFNEAQLTQLFSEVKPDPKVIHAIARPHEKTMSWYRYRQIFVTNVRAQEGAEFWREHAQTLAYAEQRYGVPAPIIIAIIGVETRYGLNEGHDNALTSLTTLAFDYPPRAPFFKSELEQYLLLTREDHLNPLTLQSSYAGALGLPQFMPHSYRQYAVDYSGKGYSDLFHNADDAIVSVANYFQSDGWQAGAPITTRAWVNGQAYLNLPHELKPQFTLAELTHYGVHPYHCFPAQQPATLITLQARDGNEYWLGFHNFYVITRYNASPMYAMAVYQLSELIRYYYQHPSAWKNSNDKIYS